MKEKRSTFTGSLGFIMAAASSAIGLGNIWRFPYLAAKYGGSAFLIVYIILVLTFGFALMTAEIVIGRKTGLGPLTAFGKLNKKWGFVGFLATLVPVLILPYYNVIGGWVVNYTTGYIGGFYHNMASDTYFTDMLADPSRLIMFHIIFTAAITAIIMGGVTKGIERASKILMPILFILAIAISIYSITLPGAMDGVKYFFVPNMEHFSLQGILAAMGQMFFSLSLAMGIMVAYGSYLPKTSNIEKSVAQIEIFDTLIAILAGLMIIPAVFAFSGGDESALGKGPGLMFVTLPKVFASMGGTRFAGSAFFLLVLFAALTSAMSVMEAIVASVCDKFGWSRNKAALASAVWAAVGGIVCILGYSVWSGVKFGSMDILDTVDFLTNSVIMPITALLTCIFVGYIFGVDNIKKEIALSGQFKREKLFCVMIKYIAPIFVIAVLISSVLDAFGIIKF
ncbi:MAG: sodium-dependent transporter [bacterium]|nr:sodium-dependent transporter [bacterium]